jgi:tetratricopeptide (TPR) repeat protein
MKKFNLLIALTLLAGSCVGLAARVQAQDAAAQQVEFERNWYDICYTKKDNEKCYTLSKELIAKYPSSQYKPNAEKNIKNYELNNAWRKFNEALEAYYKGPDPAKFDALYSAGDTFLSVEPDKTNPFHLFATGQMALAGHGAGMSQMYKDLDKIKTYVERAISVYGSTGAAPDKFKTEYASYVDPLRELVKARGHQFLAYRLVETKGSQDEALAHLAKAVEVKHKDGEGWKDPNNYWMRANIYSKQYENVRKEYDALPDDQKTGDAGKALLTKVSEIIDKMLPDYARTVVTATKPEYKDLLKDATGLFESFWKFRTDAPEKGSEFIDAFRTDPTVTGPAIPAKAETANMTAPAAPVAGGTGVKVAAGASGMAPGGKNGAAATNGNGAKAAPAAKGRGKGRRRR